MDSTGFLKVFWDSGLAQSQRPVDEEDEADGSFIMVPTPPEKNP